LPNLLEIILLGAPMLLLSVIAHEYAHGYAALRQGDATAQRLGRLTWNPVKHIDPFMTILMPVLTASTMGIMFGGAKPVPVDPRNFRNYRRGDIIVSLAGVAANAVLLVLCALLFVTVGIVWQTLGGPVTLLRVLQQIMLFGMFINALLIGFNLLPIPPLDGSHVVKHLLPPALAAQYQRIGAAGLVILLLLITFARPVLSAWLSPFFFIPRTVIQLARPLVIPS
jgi:Zn-dependent protease